MKNTIDQCQAMCGACVVICDPHVDGENEPLWLLASLVVSCALKGRRTPSISLAVNNQPVIVVLTGEFLFFNMRGVCCRWVCEMTVGAPRKTLQGDLGLCKLAESPALNHPPLISRLQSYCNHCSLWALCGINVTEINFTIFFSLDPPQR